jgi:triosephosphate isomerase
VREKLEKAGACDMAGMLYACDKPAGAFVGSGKMLFGCQMGIWITVGHSESRPMFGESDRWGRSTSIASPIS